MSAPYTVRGQKSNQIIWKRLENKPEHSSTIVWWTSIFNNMGSFCSFISERMKQTYKSYRKGQKGYKEK